ncbi:PH domain protein [Aspergillus heteromorphus CBS 117.55]|uniref:PH domain protein n=1 Tax=Aspergillus heteromorphus CBS 117.55 TaxID=1448321 RepID=A0A317UZQ1_9EURO|nr:PH domain protein [Aspergillus heteromorphus CBS 117.55]PWY67166.1 PH domain protein [Aspergillus heteromorphus CBS 117.55]
MSAQLASLVSKRILGETARNHFGQEDPYFEQVPASRLNRAFGKKTQKRRKAIPPGLSENDSKVLTQVKRRAYRLDLCLFSLCGIRFGWGSVIGLFPFIGDGADAALALMVVRTCDKIDGGLPSRLRMMMLMNIVLDFFIGLVPFIGDVADAVYKCNTRNAMLLEKHLRQKGAKTLSRHDRRKDDDIDMSLPDEFDRYDDTALPEAPDHRSQSHGRHPDGPAKPQAAKHPQRNRSQGRWFGGRSHREGDLETGVVDNS